MTIKTWTSVGAAVVVAAAALMTGAWVLHQTAGQASAKEIEVEVGDSYFEAKTITVAVGDTVVWKLEGAMGHTVTSDTGVFDSGQGPLKEGDTFSFTFTQPGTYPYYCRFHGGPGGVGMSGTVVVEAAGQQPTLAPAPAPTTVPAPTTAPPPASGPSGGAAGQSITVNLGPGRDASQPGTAVLMAQGNQTIVTIDIAPGAAGVPQPVHIHEGTCANLGAVKYPLTNIVDGKSTTMVNVPLSDLQTGGFAINAHKSQAEINVYVACGNIPASTTSTAPTGLPVAGTGGLQSYGGGGISPWWYALAAGGGLLLVGGSYGLWRARARK